MSKCFHHAIFFRLKVGVWWRSVQQKYLEEATTGLSQKQHPRFPRTKQHHRDADVSLLANSLGKKETLSFI